MAEHKYNDKKGGRLSHDIFLFLFGPVIFITLVKFTGYSIFYQGDPTDEERKRTAWILSGGAVFYLIILFILILTDE
jgi:hypothetical protein